MDIVLKLSKYCLNVVEEIGLKYLRQQTQCSELDNI